MSTVLETGEFNEEVVFSNLEDAVEHIITTSEEKPSFRDINNALISIYPIMFGDTVDTYRFYNFHDIHDVVLELETKYGEIMNSRKYSKFMDLESLNVLEKEGFSYILDMLPKTTEKLKNGTPVAFRINPAERPPERGYVFGIECNDNVYVTKPLQSDEELNISQRASDKLIGPKIYEINERVMFEEFMDDTRKIIAESYSELEKDQYFTDIYYAMGEFLGKTHKEGIVINHAEFYEELRITGTKEHINVRMLDWGTSKLITDCDSTITYMVDIQNFESGLGPCPNTFIEGYKQHMDWPII